MSETPDATFGLGLALFWMSALILAYTYGGYHILMAVLSRTKPKLKSPPPLSDLPEISVIVVMKNEAAHVLGRIENLQSQYPAEKMEIIVFLDAPTDNTFDLIQTQEKSNLKVYHESQPRGKSYCLAQAISKSKNDFLVFADGRQLFQPGAIKSLVTHLSLPDVGAVSGELVLSRNFKEKSITSSYWELEKMLRKSESRFSSVIGCTGAIYAVKKSLCPTIPADTLLDDVLIPLGVSDKGFRVIFDSSAIAIDPFIPSPRQEFHRKRRTLAGNFQLLFRYPEWLFPWKYPLWWQLLSHKYIRLIAPYFGLYIVIFSILSASHPLFLGLVIIQITAILLGGLGVLLKHKTPGWISPFASFLLLNMASISAFPYYMSGTYRLGWKK